VGQHDEPDPAERAAAVQSVAEGLRQLSDEVRALGAALRRGGGVARPVLRELRAAHRALRDELDDVHRRDMAGDFDAAAHMRFRERTLRLADRLDAARREAGG
jgi:hypothetical protein